MRTDGQQWTTGGREITADVDNVSAYFGRFATQLAGAQFGKEIWRLYEKGLLKPDTPLTGHIEQDMRQADVGAVMRAIQLAEKEEAERQRRIALANTP